jgi:hypothetical protein
VALRAHQVGSGHGGQVSTVIGGAVPTPQFSCECCHSAAPQAPLPGHSSAATPRSPARSPRGRTYLPAAAQERHRCADRFTVTA